MTILRVWSLLIRTASDAPTLGQGYALAETMGEAIELAEHPEAVALPTKKMWPGSPAERLYWMNGAGVSLRKGEPFLTRR